tara:strand:+ start:186 stop:590 length:405 start_codon:yes stop_codon:yes gene_type:complete
MSEQIIVDNQKLYEAIFFGPSTTTHTVDVSNLYDSVAIDGVDKQRMSLKILYSVDSGGYLKVELATDASGSTFAEYWRGYGNGEIYIKNTEASGNGDFKITFDGAAGSCKISALKTEGFTLASPYYTKVSRRTK